MVGRYLSAYHFGGGQCQGRFQDIGAVGLEFLVAAAVSTGVSMLAHSDKKPNILVLMGDAIARARICGGLDEGGSMIELTEYNMAAA